MNGKSSIVQTVRLLALTLMLTASAFPAQGVETYTTRTNWVERSITNVIEVTMPMNRFVNEYHTNRIEQLRTNIVIVYDTNWLTRTVTNLVVVDTFRTNFANAYRTNWKSVTLTNQVMVDAYTTNRKTFNVTNWETVLVMKTNWITQPITNVVQIDLATKGEALTQTGANLKEALVLEASKTARSAADNHAEVQLRVKSGGDAGAPLQVLKWKVERDDGTLLSFGQEQEFKRELPVGKYKVEARVQGEAGTPVQVLRGTLEVTPRDAFIQQQKLFGKN